MLLPDVTVEPSFGRIKAGTLLTLKLGSYGRMLDRLVIVQGAQLRKCQVALVTLVTQGAILQVDGTNVRRKDATIGKEFRTKVALHSAVLHDVFPFVAFPVNGILKGLQAEHTTVSGHVVRPVLADETPLLDKHNIVRHMNDLNNVFGSFSWLFGRRTINLHVRVELFLDVVIMVVVRHCLQFLLNWRSLLFNYCLKANEEMLMFQRQLTEVVRRQQNSWKNSRN